MILSSKCANYASETCPCVLAEKGRCLVCSMCRGEEFCDCSDTTGFCILQELQHNGGRAKDPCRPKRFTVADARKIGDSWRFIRIELPDENLRDFEAPGCYVFLRTGDNAFFDVPICVMDADAEAQTLGFLIESRGLKTQELGRLRKGDSVVMRGPYFGSIQGRKSIGTLRDNNALLICRGSGVAASPNIIRALQRNGNGVEVYLDSGRFPPELAELGGELCKADVREIALEENGSLTEAARKLIGSASSKVGLIHLGVSEYLIARILELIDVSDRARGAKVSCISSATMCCGEGICGSCTRTLAPDRVVRLCKEQVDPRVYSGMFQEGIWER